MFPINVNLQGRTVLLIGAGRVGRRKLAKLLDSGALVRLVEPSPAEEVSALAASGRVELAAELRPEHFNGVSFVFAASDQNTVNRAAAEEAKLRGIWVNVADDPDFSDFTLPALVEQGDLLLAVSTHGASPALAAVVATELRSHFGPEYRLLTRLLASLRPVILSSGLDEEKRKNMFRQLAESKMLRELLAKGRTDAALTLLERLAAPVDLSGFDLNSCLSAADKL